MNVNYYSKCCGLKEIDGLSPYGLDSKGAMLAFCKIIYPTQAENDVHLKAARDRASKMGVKDVEFTDRIGMWGNYAYNGAFDHANQYSRFRHVTFSEAWPGNACESKDSYKYGRNFAAFILANKLGTVIDTPREVNPNSDNLLKVWVWTINHEALRKWYGKQEKADTKFDPLMSVAGAPGQILANPNVAFAGGARRG